MHKAIQSRIILLITSQVYITVIGKNTCWFPPHKDAWHADMKYDSMPQQLYKVGYAYVCDSVCVHRRPLIGNLDHQQRPPLTFCVDCHAIDACFLWWSIGVKRTNYLNKQGYYLYSHRAFLVFYLKPQTMGNI